MKNYKILFIVFSLVWCLVLAGFAVSYLVGGYAGGEFIESENRTLAPRPEVSAENVFSGKFGTQFENFLSDHAPGREKIISFYNELKNSLSLATDEDVFILSLRTDDGGKTGTDPENTSRTDESTAPIIIYTEPPATETSSPESSTSAPESGTLPPDETSSPEVSGNVSEDTQSPPEDTTEEITTVITEPPTEPVTEPVTEVLIPPKSPATLADFPDTLNVAMKAAGKETVLQKYSKANVVSMMNALEDLAKVIPDDGTVVFTIVQQSGYGNRYVTASQREYFTSMPEKMIDAVSSAKVRAFSAADVLGPMVVENKYVYFRTDMHITTEANYELYRTAATLAGKKPASLTDFNSVSEVFRGTLYRDEPAKYGKYNPDTLDKITPKFDATVKRIVGKDQYTVIPFIDENAPSNDRYCTYLGGPAGPWTYIDCSNGMKDRCLVICDSFGMIFQTFLTANYNQVHYMDPRYFSQSKVGYTIGEMIDKYNIKDIYVVIGDLHSYGKNFLEPVLKGQLQ